MNRSIGTMMKKTIALALMLALALGAVAAQAATGDAILGLGEEGNREYFRYTFVDGDTLYLVSYDALFSYHLGDEDMQRCEYEFQGEPDEEGYDTALFPFCGENGMGALMLMTDYSKEYTEFLGAKLCTLTPGDDGMIAVEPTMDVNWDELVEYYDQNSYPKQPENVISTGDSVVLRCSDDAGEYAMYTLNTTNGTLSQMDGISDVWSLVPYKDGQVLVMQYNGNNDPEKVRFIAYDPASESEQPLCEAAIRSYTPLEGLAYDPETDAAYCVRGGEICPLDLSTGEVGAGITDMPLEMYSNSPGASMLPGGYYVFASSGAAVRNLDPTQKAERRLKVVDSAWSDAINTTFYQFSNAHGDISVVLSREYSDTEHIIEDMMNRGSDVDIYVMSTAAAEYDAVFNRGYMMELDGSESLMAFADSAYPALRDALTHDGRLVAVPTDTYAWCMGVNREALKSLGMTMEDVPTNWMDFLDFLVDLGQVIKPEGNISVFYSDMSAEDVKNQLFYTIFDDYQKYVNAVDPTMGYNTDLLRGLLSRLESIDFTALGYEHDDGENEDRMIVYSGDDEKISLFQMGSGCTPGNFYTETYTPILMAMDAQTPAILSLDTTVAFINPFTTDPEAALAFMEALEKNMPQTVRYCFDPSQNEPVRGVYNEQYQQEMLEELANLKAELEGADPEESQELEESIRNFEESMEMWDKYGWEISRESIDWYRSNDEHLTLSTVSWLYADNSGEAWSLMSQYQEGRISLDEMLTGIDKKVQMMLLEGN